MNGFKELQSNLFEALRTPVSEVILNQLSEKQIWYLKAMCENILKPNEGAFYYKGEQESLEIIKNILEQGKNKIPARKYSNKTEIYLKLKNI